MDFDQIINAIDNSNQDSSGQMATILSTMQQMSDSYGADPSTVQSVLSIVVTTFAPLCRSAPQMVIKPL